MPLRFHPLALLLLCGSALSSSAAERPNVLFIAVDDMNVNLGCYGDTQALSPNLDRLAERGLVFRRAYCQQAVCNPSRASLLTGRRPDTIRVWDLRADFRATLPDIGTLPQHFKRHGYHTQAIGKIFHNMGDLDDAPSWTAPAVLHAGRHSEDYALEENRRGGGRKMAVVENVEAPDTAYRDGQIARLAAKTLGTLKDGPFFLAVGFWRPHAPFVAPRKYWERYRREKIDRPANPDPPRGAPQIALHQSREIRGYGGVPKTGEIPAETVQQMRHGYYASISFVDEQIGIVLDELERLGLDERTIVVFWSDHGYHLGEHGLWCKTSNFELDARVPLVVSAPGMASAGQQTEALVELVDLYPTLVDLCGLPTPAGLEGVSLRPVLADPAARVKQAAFTQHPRPFYGGRPPEAMGYSVRTDHFRYTEWRSLNDGSLQGRELYDHRRDPRETVNVVESAKHAEAISEGARRLRSGFPHGSFGAAR